MNELSISTIDSENKSFRKDLENKRNIKPLTDRNLPYHSFRTEPPNDNRKRIRESLTKDQSQTYGKYKKRGVPSQNDQIISSPPINDNRNELKYQKQYKPLLNSEDIKRDNYMNSKYYDRHTSYIPQEKKEFDMKEKANILPSYYKNEPLNKDYNNTKKDIDELKENEIEKLKNIIKNKDKELTDMNKQLELLQKEKKYNEINSRKEREEFEKKEKEYKDLLNKNNSDNSEIKLLKQQNIEKQRELEEEIHNKNILIEQNQYLKNYVNQYYEECKQAFDQIKAELEEMKRINSKLKDENDRLKRNENNLLSKMREYEKKLNKNDSEMKKELNDKTDLSEKLRKYENYLNKLQNELNNEKNYKDKIMRENNSLLEKNKNNENIMKNLDKENNDLYKRINELQKILNDSYTYNNELKYENEDLKKEIDNLQKGQQKENIYFEDKNPPLVGLNNIGATCFMNATLQCLSQTKDLTNYFLKEKNRQTIFNNNIASRNRNDLQLCPVYYELIHKLWDKNGPKSFSPYNFMNTIEKMNPLFKQGQAGDSKDFIIYILEQIHKELKKNVKGLNKSGNFGQKQPLNQYDRNNALNYFFDQFTEECSIISDILFGFNETTNECLNCKKNFNSKGLNNPICYNYGIFNCLIFPLEEVRKTVNSMRNINNGITLYECFCYNQKTEYFTGDNKNYCNVCKQLCDSLYTSKIFCSPMILILILNRGKDNIYDVKINFNEVIDITEFILEKDKPQITYELYGVITHIGKSGPNAHFVASCKNPVDNKWYRFNDAIINPITNLEREVLNYGNPYILFYKKIK